MCSDVFANEAGGLGGFSPLTHECALIVKLDDMIRKRKYGDSRRAA